LLREGTTVLCRYQQGEGMATDATSNSRSDAGFDN